MAAPQDIFKNIVGTLSSYFHIGSATGPRLTNNSGAIEARNSDGSALAVIRAAAPVGDNDVVTKRWAQSVENPLIVSTQMDGGAPPAPAGVGYIVVTTAGGGYSIGDVVYDDGVSLENLGTVDGRAIFITVALAGGTISFDPDSLYLWDDDGGSWVKIGDIGSVGGAIRVIRKVLDNSAQQDTTTPLPASSRVLECIIEVTTPYSGGASIQVGDTATADKFMGTTQNVPQVAKRFSVEQDTSQVASSVVRVTVGGAPAAGAGVLLVYFSQPLA